MTSGEFNDAIALSQSIRLTLSSCNNTKLKIHGKSYTATKIDQQQGFNKKLVSFKELKFNN